MSSSLTTNDAHFARASYHGALDRLRLAGIALPFLALFIILAIVSDAFLTPTNLLNILDQQAATLIIAAAGTLVLISGGLDLSVGAVYALGAVVGAQISLNYSVPLGIAAALATGLFVGLINGVLTSILRINALIATLATSFVVGGSAALLTGGNIVTLYKEPAYGYLARSYIATIAMSTWVALAVIALLALILSRSAFGRYVYASGDNVVAARLAGVQVSRVKIVAFMLSGAAAALGGLIDSSRVLSAQSNSGGNTLTFTVIAGIVVGGTSILGGEGAVWRSVIGVLFIALIGNGYNIIGLDPLYQQITVGIIILIAVGVDAAGRQRSMP
jgi:ribose transport system permease protein